MLFGVEGCLWQVEYCVLAGMAAKLIKVNINIGKADFYIVSVMESFWTVGRVWGGRFVRVEEAAGG